MKTPTLLLPLEYKRDAIRAISAAKRRVLLLAMVLTDDIATDGLIDALAEAAKRGINVEVAADIFTYGKYGGHLRPYKFFAKQSRVTTAMVKELEKSGVKFSWLGRFALLPYTGRNHMKCLVVDDTIYSFGGVNIDEESFSNNDYMLRCVDRQLSNQVHDTIKRIIGADDDNFSYRSQSFTYGKYGNVLIDGGLQGDSIIFRRACELAKNATHITYVSQYGPTGKLARLLKKTSTDFYFNPPQTATEGYNRFLIRFGLLFHRQTTLYKRKKYLHAKFIIFSMPDGEKVAITGSYNFIWGSVLFGTREIALETKNKKIIKQLEAFLQKSIT
jgi:cardiolipin synthase